MANLTRKNVSDIVRANLGELDSQKIEQGLLNLYINLAQRKVQQDLMPLLGMKAFTKETVIYPPTTSLPSDLLMSNDSVIKIKAGTGVKASGTMTAPLQDAPNSYSITITAKKAGSLWNYKLKLVDDSQVLSPTVSLSGTNIYVTMEMSGSTITCALIVNALNNSTLVNSDFIFSTTTPSAKPLSENSVTLTNGANPTTYYPCREMTIEEYIDVPDNTYLAPLSTAPQFVRRGNTSGTQTIEFLPSTINYAIVYHRYLVPDLSADSSTLGIPIEYEEMVINDVTIRCYDKLKANAESQAKQVEYATKIKQYESSYMGMRNSIGMEKARLESNDPGQ